MDQLPDFSSVVSGTILVNGQSLSLDPAVDSTEDVAARISADISGVQAGVSSGKLWLSSASSFEIQDNGSSFFSTWGLADQTVQATTQQPSDSRANSRKVARELGEVSERINQVFEQLGTLPIPDEMRNGLRDELLASMRDFFGNQDATAFTTSFGMGISFDQNAPLISFDPTDALNLRRQLENDFTKVEQFLVGTAGRGGLVSVFGDFFESAQSSVAALSGGLGMRVDLNA